MLCVTEHHVEFNNVPSSFLPMNIQKNSYGLLSIRSRILIFSVLVTLVPSFGMGWLFYDMTKQATTEKTEQRLLESAGIVEREITRWFKERDHDLHVFASSFVIIDNLTGYLASSGQEKQKKKENQAQSSLKKIATYLSLVKNQFSEYRKLAVLDLEGKVVATSDPPDADRSLALPADWRNQISAGGYFVGEVAFKDDEPSPLTVIGIPLTGHDAPLGVFVVEVRLRGLLPFLKTALGNGDASSGEVLLVQKNGLPLLSTAWPEGYKEAQPISAQEMQLFISPHHLRAFDKEQRVVGLAVPFKDLPWGIVIEQKYELVFAGIIQSRERIILIAILFSLVIGLCASIVAGQIILPLDTLMQGVLQVANGGLDVRLDVRRNDEFGIVTGMFNEMVTRLRQSQQELEQLATTDALTKLANRKQIMTSLETHVEYFRRYGTEFSLLMIDIDHFKRINDSHGHLAGDAVLVQLAQIFRDVLRSIDIAGRYGGEEFLIILGQTDLRKAVVTAERIRQAVEQHLFIHQDIRLHATISTGVAGITQADDTDNTLIGRADSALYEAKATGRNRVVLSTDILPGTPSSG
jgi:diguanylate cyclase (GGDEF)-like protein